jgi:two-component system LytT family sensor kinase
MNRPREGSDDLASGSLIPYIGGMVMADHHPESQADSVRVVSTGNRGRVGLIILVGWTLFGLFMALQSYAIEAQAGAEVSWHLTLVREMIYAYLWALFTPIILWLSRKFRIERARTLPNVPVQIAASIIVAIVQKFLFSSGYGLYRSAVENTGFSWGAPFRNILAFLDYGILLYWMLLVVQHLFDYYHQYREKELQTSSLKAQLAQAQLSALKMQLQPHFLFNTLNAISVLIGKDATRAKEMLSRLSDLLRMTLDHSGVQLVSLQTELKFLESYLEIERIRFADRLEVTMEVEPNTLHVQIPSLILQPLVENAIHHGVNEQRGKARITIAARQENGSLLVIVKDNGKGLPQSGYAMGGRGIGLSNTRARLEQLFGSEGEVRLMNLEEGGVAAIVTIPLGGSNEERQWNKDARAKDARVDS